MAFKVGHLVSASGEPATGGEGADLLTIRFAPILIGGRLPFAQVGRAGGVFVIKVTERSSKIVISTERRSTIVRGLFVC